MKLASEGRKDAKLGSGSSRGPVKCVEYESDLLGKSQITVKAGWSQKRKKAQQKSAWDQAAGTKE